ncbi:MAG: serine/threonine protein kinase [Deltaproteobacteria bacterium]|nr:MAG: serine/threonine protein kinase [Deltaproteobacteria bacterium]
MITLCAGCGENVRLPDGQGSCPACGGPALLDGRYRLESVVGRGAMGTTYAARRVIDGAAVAIKELLVARVDSLDTQARFEGEGQTLAELAHPGVVAFVEQFMAGDGRLAGWYIVSELVRGATLAEERTRHRYDAVEVTTVIEELAGTLAYLHGRQPAVVHRDLKPSNVIRRERDGRLVLIDFGAVRDVAAGAVDTPSVTGTVGFMAPEQLAGDAGPAADVYALGATAVALLTGRAPIALLDEQQRLRWRDAVEAPRPLVELLEEMLAADPADRPTAETLVRHARNTRWAIEAGLPSASPSRDDLADDASAADGPSRTASLWLGGGAAVALALGDLGGAITGHLPWALALIGMGLAWGALFVASNALGDGDGLPLLAIAAMVGLAGLLFDILTHDVDSGFVYLVDGVVLASYAVLLAAAGWCVRSRGAPSLLLLAFAALSIAMAVPFLLGAVHVSWVEHDLTDIVWRVGAVARGFAHLLLLPLLLKAPAPAAVTTAAPGP